MKLLAIYENTKEGNKLIVIDDSINISCLLSLPTRIALKADSSRVSKERFEKLKVQSVCLVTLLVKPIDYVELLNEFESAFRKTTVYRFLSKLNEYIIIKNEVIRRTFRKRLEERYNFRYYNGIIDLNFDFLFTHKPSDYYLNYESFVNMKNRFYMDEFLNLKGNFSIDFIFNDNVSSFLRFEIGKFFSKFNKNLSEIYSIKEFISLVINTACKSHDICLKLLPFETDESIRIKINEFRFLDKKLKDILDESELLY